MSEYKSVQYYPSFRERNERTKKQKESQQPHRIVESENLVKINLPDTPLTITNYEEDGTVSSKCVVTEIWSDISKSGDQYGYTIYLDCQKTFDGSDDESSPCKIGYQLSQGDVVADEGTTSMSQIVVGESFADCFDGLLDPGDYTLRLLDVT